MLMDSGVVYYTVQGDSYGVIFTPRVNFQSSIIHANLKMNSRGGSMPVSLTE